MPDAAADKVAADAKTAADKIASDKAAADKAAADKIASDKIASDKAAGDAKPGDAKPGDTARPSPFGDVSNTTYLYLALAFAAAYALVYGLTAVAGRAGGDTASRIATSRTIDAALLVLVVAASALYYYSFSDGQKNNLTATMLEETKVFYDDPNSMLYFFLATIGFYVIVYACGVPMTTETQGFMVWFVEVHLWYFLGTLAIDYAMKYYLDVPIADILIDKTGELLEWMGLMKHSAALDVAAKPNKGATAAAGGAAAAAAVVAPAAKKPEVFNVSNNTYSYSEAQSICSAYGAKMATYDQLEDAYKDGANWCNYGWSADQMALFPVQKSTWKDLQGRPGHENDCGRPGINGGRIANPSVKFGVNCFGVKPEGSVAELAAAKAGKTYPKSREDEIMEAKVRYWKKNKDKMLVLNSFNDTKWSNY